MHLGRSRRTATAVAAAVIGGLLGGVPGAAQALPGVSAVPAAPAPPRTPAAPAPPPAGSPASPESTARDAVRESARVPAVWPRPQSLAGSGPSVRLGDEVTLLADADADPYALAALRELLRATGVRTVHTGLPGRGPPPHTRDQIGRAHV